MLTALNDPHIQLLTSRLGKPILTSNNQVRFNSPFVPIGKRPDKKHHLYVCTQKKKFFCFRSSMGGSLSYLFVVLGEEYDNPDPPMSPVLDLKRRAYDLTSEVAFKPPLSGFPDEYMPIRVDSKAHRYLRLRGITDDDIVFYKIGEGLQEYANWLIIPSLDEYGRCTYWVARNTDDQAEGHKYDNPQVARKYHVGFLHSAMSFSKDGSVVLCEGVFSAIIAGRTAVVSYGKYVTNNQLSALQKAGVETIRLCLDGDAWKETLDVADRALRRGFKVTIIPMPLKEDPADMGRERFYKHLESVEYPVIPTTLLQIRLGAML